MCSTVASSAILAVQFAERAPTACNYCQNHLLALSVDVIYCANAGGVQHGTCTGQFLWKFLTFSFRAGIVNFLPALHHWQRS